MDRLIIVVMTFPIFRDKYKYIQIGENFSSKTFVVFNHQQRVKSKYELQIAISCDNSENIRWCCCCRYQHGYKHVLNQVDNDLPLSRFEAPHDWPIQLWCLWQASRLKVENAIEIIIIHRFQLKSSRWWTTPQTYSNIIACNLVVVVVFMLSFHCWRIDEVKLVCLLSLFLSIFILCAIQWFNECFVCVSHETYTNIP